MFSKSSNSRNSAPSAAAGAKNPPFSIIGGDVTISGDIAASVDLHIDGAVEGDIACAALVQGADSRIKGHVSAKTARIGGLVEGSISAEDLTIEASARITGDVSYERINIATGGLIDGKMTHLAAGAGTSDLKLVQNEAS